MTPTFIWRAIAILVAAPFSMRAAPPSVVEWARTIDVDAKMAEPNERVCFESMESSGSVGHSVINCVVRAAGGARTAWWLRQRKKSDQNEGDDPRRWPLFLIVVDRSADNVASFYQFAAAPFDSNAKEVPLEVPCFNCHANGPRALRASKLWGETPRSEILDAINLEIAADSAITPATSVQNRARFFGNEPARMTPLRLKACSNCHDGKNRAILRFAQRDTIAFMAGLGPAHSGGTAFMPPGGMSSQDRQALLDWLDGTW